MVILLDLMKSSKVRKAGDRSIYSSNLDFLVKLRWSSPTMYVVRIPNLLVTTASVQCASSTKDQFPYKIQ